MKNLILVLFLFSLTSCNKRMSTLTEKNHKNDVWETLKQGQKYADADNYNAAKNAYDLALNMDSDLALGYFYRAILNFEHGNYNETLLDLEKLEPFLWIDGDEVWKKTRNNKRLTQSKLLFMRSESYLYLKNYSKARENLNKLIKLEDELYGTAIIDKGFLEIVENQYNDALSTLETVEEANKKNYTFNILKAIAYNETQQFSKKTETLKTIRSLPQYFGYDLTEIKFWNKGFDAFEKRAEDILGKTNESMETIKSETIPENENNNLSKNTLTPIEETKINAFSYLLVTTPINCSVVINGLSGYKIHKEKINRLPMEQGINIVQFQPFGEQDNEILKEFDFITAKNQKFEIKITGN